MDIELGLLCTVLNISSAVADIIKRYSLLHGKEMDVFNDAGYQSIQKRTDAKEEVV